MILCKTGFLLVTYFMLFKESPMLKKKKKFTFFRCQNRIFRAKITLQKNKSLDKRDLSLAPQTNLCLSFSSEIYFEAGITLRVSLLIVP